ncbi:hypothetical protein WJX82_002263 [Trebouxia sp. C0006]
MSNTTMHSKALVISCTYNQAKHGVDSYVYASVQQNAYRLQQHSVRPRQVMSNPTTVCWLGAHVGATNPAATKSRGLLCVLHTRQPATVEPGS